MKPQFIECAGAHFEMGVIQGTSTKKQITFGFNRLTTSSTLRYFKPFWLPMPWFLRLLELKGYSSVRPHVEARASAQSQRMKGLAEGSEFELKKFYGLLVIELAQDIGPYHTAGCTSVAIHHSLFSGGEPLICKNFDYPNDFDIEQIVRLSAPAGRHRTLDFTYPVLAGNHNGMNEFGLSCLYTVVTPTHQTPGLPPTLIIQELLERCRTVNEAINFLTAVKRGRGANYMLGDADGHVAVVESTSRFVSVRKAQNGYIVSTNHFVAEKMERYDIPKNAVYTEKALPAWRGKRVRESTERRLRSADALVKEFIGAKQKLELDNIFSILRDHEDGRGGETTICNHGSVGSTLGSIVMLPKQKKIFVLNGKPCREKFVEFEL